MSYCPRPSHAATTGISNDEIQSQILTATESAVAGSASGLATISAGRRIANESGKVDVSGLRQWITAKPELCQEFQALLHSIKFKEVVEEAIGLVNEDLR
jgi:dephospho-CoA kinase